MKVADAFIVAGVEIGNLSNAHLFGGIADRIENLPRQPRRLDAPAAADAVMFAGAEEMIFRAQERWRDVVIAPAGKAKLSAMVVVGGLSPHRDHGVDGT